LDGRRVLAVELHNGRRSESLATSLLKSVQFAGVHQVRVVKQMPVDVRHNSKIDYTALRVLLEKSE